MTLSSASFTPYPDVNAILARIIPGVQEVLGERLLGLYLEGSLASGNFDAASDIDFTAVVEDAVPLGGDAPAFLALQAMHDRLAQLDSPWAIQIEGFYLTRRAVRRHDPGLGCFPNIERGLGERLKLVELDADWDVHRWVLRERGIPLFGPPANTLIDPVTPDQLRQAMQPVLFDWGASLLGNPERMQPRGSQSYVVLTLCRLLYTLATGAVASKPAAARWALANLSPRWSGLIERAILNRLQPDGAADPQDIAGTLALLRFAQQHSSTRGE